MTEAGKFQTIKDEIKGRFRTFSLEGDIDFLLLDYLIGVILCCNHRSDLYSLNEQFYAAHTYSDELEISWLLMTNSALELITRYGLIIVKSACAELLEEIVKNPFANQIPN